MSADRPLRYVIRPGESGRGAELGGKAAALASLRRAGIAVPRWFVLSTRAFEESAERPLPRGGDPTRMTAVLPEVRLGAAVRAELEQALSELAPDGALLAVRSSAGDEDGVEHSFAGQFESYLFVPPSEVADRVLDVWRSAHSERVLAYRRERGLRDVPVPPAVLVQRMVHAQASGVAFSADPVSGRRGLAVVAATYGVGTSLVSGEHDADSYHVDRAGRIVSRAVAQKRVAHRRGPGGVVEERVPDSLALAPALADEQVCAVAELARRAARHFGAPQDIEWAIERGELYLLQSRPITSLAALSDPDGALSLWDNSNITESYGGVTTPLTYSFARYVYEEVYRQFCRIVRVPEERIEANAPVFRCMIGLVRGRVYYNLLSWYRVLALLPGYTLNRRFMEQMMGVREPLPDDVVGITPVGGWRARAGDALAVLRMLGGLVGSYVALPRAITRFHARLDAALAGSGTPLSDLRADELAAHYRDLERQLLRRWDAPLVNDFFAMIFYGVLRKLVERWCGDTHGTLQNDLVAADGGVVSAEPARRITELARLAAPDAALVDALCDAPLDEALEAIAAHPALRAGYDEYLERFGDRCLEELKLETTTLRDDPLLLVRSIGRLARAGVGAGSGATVDVRGEAEAQSRRALARRPVRRLLFGWVLRQARARVRDRENLRFERTRVFGHVRRIFVELGRRFAAAGLLADPRDVFHLEVEEILGMVDGTATATDLRGLVAVRRAEFARYHEEPPPADRFETRGMVHYGNDFAGSAAEPALADGELRTGTGCYPGVVRGRVRVVRDPRDAVLAPGEILVAERTDPGWVMLFPSAAGLLVERGSLLSHSAIVARELGLPAVVAIPGLTSWLRTGDWVEFDGRRGEVRRVDAPAEGGDAE